MTDDRKPLPALRPIWSVVCRRCEDDVEVECRCRLIPEDALALCGEGARAHAATCRPTYRADGGALPDRCPTCKAPRWLEAPLYRRGAGTSRATMYRRRAARAAKRG